MSLLIIRILAGHFIGDFILQTKTIAENKMEKWSYLFAHVASVFLAMALCTIGYWSSRLVISLIIISLMHLLDRLKRGKEGKTSWFFGDQLLHLLSIAIIPAIFGIWPLTDLADAVKVLYNDQRLWVYTLGYMAGVWGGSIMIGTILGSIKRPDCKEVPVSPLASKIGIVERLIVITLAIFNQYTAIGFVFAIKGVARKVYTEQDVFQGEIYFLGTGLSFFTAIATALLIRWLLGVVG